MSPTLDPVELGRALIRCESVTPADGGALELLKKALEEIGFACQVKIFSEDGTPDIANLFARIGTDSPHFCFAGHTDTVPAGDLDAWSVDPFGAEIRDGILYGRGAADMKTAVACFAAAAEAFLVRKGKNFSGSISLLITGDEEGPAVNGTKKLLQWVAAEGHQFDVCLVGEPTNPEVLGDMIKIGRRGSLNGQLTVSGTAGHTAYPHLADNPVHRLVAMLSALTNDKLDDGTDHFQPSSLQISTIDVGNAATNVIPGRAEARFNVRFNDLYDATAIEAWVRERLDKVGGEYELIIQVSGEAFLSPPGPFSDVIAGAIERVTGRRPELSTSGGTSDARFIKDYCTVAEFGLIGQTMHKADERMAIADLEVLTGIYEAILEDYFSGSV
ncbi:MAG: succinyl-diaminopimelate desuccinylase [Pseudomonadota bacterium]|nr:succinyl-diaminopimelate desuccinylase [Pseudomonadota bacterium]